MQTHAIELMLADLRWTRRLASALARDGAEADDLWSETFAAAQREAKPVHRGWIRTTMTNVVRMTRRAEKRRLDRELAVGHAVDEPRTPEELLATVELQRTLVELITSLKEPYRSTLLLHHVEDLAPVEIARRLAIPAGTVRWRLKVAHDELREKLVERSGGDRDAWRLALLPLLSRQDAPLVGRAPLPEQDAPATGGTTMMTWTKLLALAFSTLAVTGVALHRSAGAAAATTTAKAPTMTAANTTAVTRAPLPPTVNAATTAAAPPKQTQAAPSTCEHCNRIAVVPSAAIADLDPPNVDECFTAVPPSSSEQRMDLSLSLSHADGIATITGAKLKYASETLAVPGLLECVQKKLIGRELPDSPSPASGPANVALLVADHWTLVNNEKAPPSSLRPDGRAPSLGEASAPLTATVFIDFQCPFSAQYVARLKSLVELYPGQLRIELRNFPLPFHQSAELGAEAALAAGEQGKYWPMHDELFAHQTSIDRPHLRSFAKKIGLDVERFERALDEGREAQRVRDDIDAGKRLGVRGVPSMIVGGEVVPGSLPVEELVKHIDRALTAQK